jgi:hypothetical protein
VKDDKPGRDAHRTAVTDADRRHFEAIAEAERLSELERIDEALRKSPGERVLEGLRLGMRAPWTPAHQAEMDARADGQMELARRALAMGMR